MRAGRRYHGQQITVVEQLLKRDDVNVSSKDEKYDLTPLFWAIQNRRNAVVQLLLERDDIDANSKDNTFSFPLF